MAFDDELAGALNETLDRLTDTLLAERNAYGHWVGELSSSALSTATAVIALTLEARAGGRAAPPPRATAGVDWLIRTQRDDGGWGDTTDSPANVSTTALCWAALTIAGEGRGGAAEALERVRDWMTRAAGSLEPEALGRTIEVRYGKDRTFSVPILTVLALAGLLDDDSSAGGVPSRSFSASRSSSARDGWRRVPQLPFELAAVPAALYRWLRLPVVSYALPALIAIGLARHRQRPTRNPATRLTRGAVTARTLRQLALLQPSSGGFLEATPLTSFVVMSLVAAGETSHPVVAPGIAFLERSARADGSWPIDTNLATWVTTLAVNGLARRSGWRERLPADERRLLIRWLLDQHHRAYHVYTAAEPGGWAWTDLPGGVPDADDTPGALLALHALTDRGDPASLDAECLDTVAAGVGWLMGLQNADGGVPTFCRGWGALPFDRSSPDLTAHALRAWTAWRPALPKPLAADCGRAVDRAVRYLERAQREDGSWVPLWFGNQRAPDEENPVYGTARVLEGLAALDDATAPRAAESRAASWLAAARSSDGGWGGAPGVAPSIEETAVALGALAAWRRRPRAGSLDPADLAAVDASIEAGVRWLIDATDGGRRAPATPIGLYFARLWYSEALYPRVFTLAALASAAGIGKNTCR